MSPFSGHYSAAELSLAQVLILAWWLFFVELRAASGEQLDQWLGEGVRDACYTIRLTDEQAADRMGMDVSQLRKALRGEAKRHISLNRLLRLGLPFWCCFGPLLFAVVVRHHLQQIADDMKRAAEDLKIRKVS